MSEEPEEEMTLPEITPLQLAEWMKSKADLVVLDVREPFEFSRAKLSDPKVFYAPLSELARKFQDALPEAAKNQAAPLVVICHHGNRSAQVTAWLLDMGWQEVYNLSGGIDAYARQIDSTVGIY